MPTYLTSLKFLLFAVVVLQVLSEGFGYVEDFKVTDIRLAICTLSCCFALAALIYDYLYPFPVSRPVLITCVLSYPLKNVPFTNKDSLVS